MFKALKSFKAPDGKGGVKMVKPGDPLPECKTWKNAAAYFHRGWITDADGNPNTGKYRSRVSIVTESSPKVAPAPPAPKPEPVPEPPAEEVTHDLESYLKGMKKTELLEVAAEMNLPEAEMAITKGDLLTAILDAEAGE